MSSIEYIANVGSSTLNGAITNVATTLVVGSASSFPANGQFRILVDSGANAEIMTVTAVSGATFTVTRATESYPGGASSGTGVAHANTVPVNQVITVNSMLAAYIDRMNNLRLTLATATPVSFVDQKAKTTVFLTPWNGNRIALYDGTNWNIATLTADLSVAVPATTNTPFDCFVQDVSGTPTLSTLNWTNATTRATALALQDGVTVLSGTVTKRFVGTCCTTATSGQCEDSAQYRYVVNWQNRVTRMLVYGENSGSFSYGTNAIKEWANGTAGTNRVGFVVPDLSYVVRVTHSGAVGTTTTSQSRADITLSADSTTTSGNNIISSSTGNTINCISDAGQGNTSMILSPASVDGYYDSNGGGIGQHYVSCNVNAPNAVAATFYGFVIAGAIDG